MYEVKQLETPLSTIEDEKNYYAGFSHVIIFCSEADTVRRGLWNVGAITDAESSRYKERIVIARQNAINTHKQWLINALKDRDLSRHTLDSFVSTIYNDIFS